MSELLTANELAARLRVRPRTVQLWARRGRIPVVRFSPKVIRYDLATVLSALESRSPRQEAPRWQS